MEVKNKRAEKCQCKDYEKTLGWGRGNRPVKISNHASTIEESQNSQTEEGTGMQREEQEEPSIYASVKDWPMDSFIHALNTQSPLCPALTIMQLLNT